MAKRPSPLLQKRTRSAPYHSDFERLKADVLADVGGGPRRRAITELPLDQLQRGRYQPRQPLTTDPALAELTDSIRVLGVIEPVVVRPLPEQPDRYEILAGDRRWRAAQQAGLERIPAVIHEVDDRTAAAIALVENLQRQDLNAIEAAAGMRRLAQEFGLNQAQLGELLGKSTAAVSKALGLLKLPAEARALIQRGQLEAGHGKVLLNLPPAQQIGLARQAARQGWSVRELERRKANLSDARRRQPRSIDPNVGRLESRLGEWFCAPVRIKANAHGGGRIEIAFASAEECDSILQRIGFAAHD